MTPLQRLTRQPNIVLAVVSGGVNLLVLLKVVDWTGEQTGGVNIFAAALFALVALMVTPSSEVVVQQKPGEVPKAAKDLRGGVVKGAAVGVKPAEGGFIDLLLALVVVVVSTAIGLGLFFGWQVAVALFVMVVVALVGVISKRSRATGPMIVPPSILDHLAPREHKHAA